MRMSHPGASLRFRPKPGEVLPACEICLGDDWREAPEHYDCDLVCRVCHGEAPQVVLIARWEQREGETHEEYCQRIYDTCPPLFIPKESSE